MGLLHAKRDKQECDRVIQKFLRDSQELDPEGLYVLKYFWVVSYLTVSFEVQASNFFHVLAQAI